MPAYTPSLGVPYPVPDDPLVDYPALGEELARKIEQLAAAPTRTLFGLPVLRARAESELELELDWAAYAAEYMPTEIAVVEPLSAVYVPPAGCIALLVECIGAGGGGGGAGPGGNGSGAIAAGAGGGGGAYASKIISGAELDPTGHTVGVPAGGYQGPPDPAGGGSPGDCYFCNRDGSISLVLAKSGIGGNAAGANMGGLNYTACAPGGDAAACIGDHRIAGKTGNDGWCYQGGVGMGGGGGDSVFGGGGAMTGAQGAAMTGGHGTTHGGGGGGGALLGGGWGWGGIGGNGLIIITELYG